ncbi:MAG: thioredoxin family protein [Bacteroidia bacterium]|nr:thioredoxin family protein [Bacteroidia bacterium]
MKFYISLLCLFVTTFSFAEHIQFETDYTTALKRAKTEQKPIFLDYTAAWCGPCKRMEKEVFGDSITAKFSWNYVTYDLYALALYNSEEEKEAVHYITKANALAVDEGIKYIPAVQRLKN